MHVLSHYSYTEVEKIRRLDVFERRSFFVYFPWIYSMDLSRVPG